MRDIDFFLQRAKEDLISFCILTDLGKNNPYKRYNPKPFHKEIASYLEGVYEGRIKKLIISVPPQH
jgi:hypothetical protein